MFTRNSIVLSNNIKTPLTAISRAIGNILQLTYGQLVKQLFSNQEQGFAYDPNDLTTLYQDAAGTIPVTAAGQPVGLMLDKSKGLVLGQEKFIEGDVTVTGESSKINATTYRIYSSAGSPSGVQLVGKLTTGKMYVVEFTIDSFTTVGDGIAVEGLLGASAIYKTTGKKRAIITPLATTFFLKRSGICDAIVSGISIKELAGNHAFQSVSASRPTLSSLVNMLTGTDKLTNWSVVNIEKVDNTIKAVGGTPLNHICHKTFTYVPSSTITYYVEVTKGVGFCFFQLCYSNINRVKCTINLATGENFVKKLSTNTTTVIVEDGGDVWRLAFTGSASGTSGVAYANMGFATSLKDDIYNSYDEPVFIADGSQRMTIKAIDVRETHIGSNLPKYQRVTSPTDYDSVGFPNYLAFDGADDFLRTNNIDFTATDKMSLFAGVRKLSDVVTGIVAELSTCAGTDTNLRAFVLYAPFDGIQKGYGFRSVGTLESTTNGTLPLSPTSNVLAAKASIAQDTLTLRVNSLHYGVLTQDQGAGNYGNYPLYIGRRGGTSFPFNGHLYSLIGIGRLTSDSETIALEKTIAKNTGVTLNV